MSTPNEPQDPYAAGNQPGAGGQPPQYPGQPPQYGAPQPPQAPQYGAPQYGAPQAPQYDPTQYGGAPGYGPNPYPKNSLGVWSLVLGICAIVLSCGLLAGIPAIIVGGRAKKAVATGEANNGGMATAGVILGWVATVLSIIGIVIFAILLSTGAWTEFQQGIEDGMNSGTY
jgi:hypothetical protein